MIKRYRKKHFLHSTHVTTDDKQSGLYFHSLQERKGNINGLFLNCMVLASKTHRNVQNYKIKFILEEPTHLFTTLVEMENISGLDKYVFFKSHSFSKLLSNLYYIFLELSFLV